MAIDDRGARSEARVDYVKLQLRTRLRGNARKARTVCPSLLVAGDDHDRAKDEANAYAQRDRQ